MAAEVQVDRLDFPVRDEREWSRLARLRLFAAASPHLTLSAVVQASSLAKLATANLRLRYNVREGDDLWVVYGHHENLDRNRISPRMPGTAAAKFLVKFTRSFGE
jgi:hypothetical protein